MTQIMPEIREASDPQPMTVPADSTRHRWPRSVEKAGVDAYVLFVDDEAANLIVWEAACGEDFNVLVASSAVEALQLLQRHEVAVVLADQRMPKMTGVELLATVRREYPDAVRILITAYADLSAAADAINRGEVRRYLRKPCEADELKVEISDALQLYDMRRKIIGLERRLLQTERVYALGLLAAGLAHEIRNPITWVHDNVRLARREIRELLQTPLQDERRARARLQEFEEMLDDALMGVQRISDIVQSLELPTRQRADELVDISEVLRLVLRIVRGELRRTSQLELDVKQVPRVPGNSNRLGQVLLNLIVNALQALSGRPMNENVITVRLAVDEKFACLDVLDNGPGILEAEIHRVFDPFYTTKGAEGTGLGLAISKRIVEEMGGTIVAENRASGGACFGVKLPLR